LNAVFRSIREQGTPMQRICSVCRAVEKQDSSTFVGPLRFTRNFAVDLNNPPQSLP
jgi:hypothetical protein